MSEKYNDQEEVIKNKILFILSNFPKVSPSMLQIGLGSGLLTSVWHEVLEKMIADKIIFRYHKSVTSPTGRTQNQTVITSEEEIT